MLLLIGITWNETLMLIDKGKTSAVRAETGANNFGEGGTKSHEIAGLVFISVRVPISSVVDHG